MTQKIVFTFLFLLTHSALSAEEDEKKLNDFKAVLNTPSEEPVTQDTQDALDFAYFLTTISTEIPSSSPKDTSTQENSSTFIP